MRFRKTNPDDLPQLKELWKLGFEDTDEEIEAFLPSLTRMRPVSARKRTASSPRRSMYCRRPPHAKTRRAARRISTP